MNNVTLSVDFKVYCLHKVYTTTQQLLYLNSASDMFVKLLFHSYLMATSFCFFQKFLNFKLKKKSAACALVGHVFFPYFSIRFVK